MSEYPSEWRECPLGEVVEKITSGGTPKADNPDLYGGSIPFLKIDDITSSTKYLRSHKITINERGLSESSAKIVPTGTLLLTMYGTIGRCCITTYPVATNQAIASFLGHPEVELEYLFYALESKADEFATASSQTTQANISAGILKQTPIAIPPLPEQKKIAEILSGIDNLTKELNNLLKKKRELLRSISLSLLGIRNQHPSIQYYSVQLSDCLTLSRGVDITKAIMNPGPYPVISSSGVSGWHNDFTHDQEGVIVGRKGSIGNVHYAYTAHWVHDTALGVADYKGNCKRYTYHLLKNLDLAKYGTASGSPSLNRNDIHPITILLPSPSDQEQIARTLDNEEVAYGKLQKKIHAVKQLKSAISSDLLSGRKRVSI